MTQLLVSVRNVSEARVALDSGADLIDIKEPMRGSLGAADADTVAAVVESVSDRVPVSIALGELLEISTGHATTLMDGIQFAKLGLAGCQNLNDWGLRWAEAIGGFRPEVAAVAVVYADPCADAPRAGLVVERAASLGCAAVLVDTHDKTSGSLTTYWSLSEIRSFVLDVQKRGMMAVVAGGLTSVSVRKMVPLQPDFVAVRGAVCRGGRTGQIDGKRVATLKKQISAGPLQLREVVPRIA